MLQRATEDPGSKFLEAGLAGHLRYEPHGRCVGLWARVSTNLPNSALNPQATREKLVATPFEQQQRAHVRQRTKAWQNDDYEEMGVVRHSK